MKVLIWATGQDTGGQGYRIARGFERHAPDWDVQSRNANPGPLGFPEQKPLPMPLRKIDITKLYAEADVVHLRNNLNGWRTMAMRKPVVVHYHGTQFRQGALGFMAQARMVGAIQLVSTLDLLAKDTSVLRWLPSPYQLDELAALREKHYQPSETIRIAHFPTSNKVKSTAAFLAATDNLAQRYPIEVIGNQRQGRAFFMDWPSVVESKATADIYYDQMILGYGNNAIEAWGMGIPVVAGVQDPRVRDLMVKTWGSLPFVEATEDTLEHQLERLIVSAQMRKEYGDRGLTHVQRWHDDAVVVEQLKDIYASARPSMDVSLPRTVPTWARRQQAPA